MQMRASSKLRMLRLVPLRRFVGVPAPQWHDRTFTCRSISTLTSVSNENIIRSRARVAAPQTLGSSRHYTDDASPVSPPDYLNEAERQLYLKVKENLEPTKLEVQDISGGCGSMYALDIVSPKFAGMSVVKQHKLVNQILAEDIKKWHGIQLKTKPS